MDKNPDRTEKRPPKPPQNGLYMITEDEMKLILRLRQLPLGSNLVIIHTDGRGFLGLSVLDNGRFEKLRPGNAEQV